MTHRPYGIATPLSDDLRVAAFSDHRYRTRPCGIPTGRSDTPSTPFRIPRKIRTRRALRSALATIRVHLPTDPGLCIAVGATHRPAHPLVTPVEVVLAQ